MAAPAVVCQEGDEGDDLALAVDGALVVWLHRLQILKQTQR